MMRTHHHKGKTRGLGKYGQPTYSQAQKIVAKFGGEASIARALGISRITAYRWSYARPYGSDGLIPSAVIDKIRQVARIEGIVLTAEDWMPERVIYPEAPQPVADLSEIL